MKDLIPSVLHWLNDDDANISTQHAKVIRHVIENIDEYVCWPSEDRLVWEGCVRGGFVRYPEQVEREAKEKNVTLDRRSNGPAIGAFALTGGKRPLRAGGKRGWSIHHIYDGKFPWKSRPDTAHAVKDGQLFTRSGGLVAIHPIADALADEFAIFAWFLRFLAYQKFGFDPDKVFSKESLNKSVRPEPVEGPVLENQGFRQARSKRWPINQRFAIPVYYSESMLAETNSFSPSAMKPRAVVESWGKLGVPIQLIAPPPVTADELCLAHAEDYVDGVLSGFIANGFGNRDLKVAASLLHTNGAMLAAARAALENGAVAVAPCSGFHHAGYDHGGGFCTFNGLMVTAQWLKSRGLVQRVGILDFDMHVGNGTDDIISRLGLDYVRHYTAGASWHEASETDDFLDAINGIVEGMSDCDLILYQAGADPHVDDPLGGFLTIEQLNERDRRVFAAVRDRNIPIAWNLAGGYQRDEAGSIHPVLEIHDNTMRTCAQAFLSQKPTMPHPWPAA